MPSVRILRLHDSAIANSMSLFEWRLRFPFFFSPSPCLYFYFCLSPSLSISIHHYFWCLNALRVNAQMLWWQWDDKWTILLCFIIKKVEWNFVNLFRVPTYRVKRLYTFMTSICDVLCGMHQNRWHNTIRNSKHHLRVHSSCGSGKKADRTNETGERAKKGLRSIFRYTYFLFIFFHRTEVEKVQFVFVSNFNS